MVIFKKTFYRRKGTKFIQKLFILFVFVIYKITNIYNDFIFIYFFREVKIIFENQNIFYDVRLDNPDMSQKQIIAKTLKIFKEDRNSSSSGTRRSRSRRGSSSSGTRRSRSRRGSSSSGTRRSRRGSRSRSRSRPRSSDL